MDEHICQCGATRFKFNLNDNIQFKPTKYGHCIYQAYWWPYNKGKRPKKIKTNWQGWAKMQLWEFMEIFGPKMQPGINIPIETEVILIKDCVEQLSQVEQSQEKNK